MSKDMFLTRSLREIEKNNGYKLREDINDQEADTIPVSVYEESVNVTLREEYVEDLIDELYGSEGLSRDNTLCYSTEGFLLVNNLNNRVIVDFTRIEDIKDYLYSFSSSPNTAIEDLQNTFTDLEDPRLQPLYYYNGISDPDHVTIDENLRENYLGDRTLQFAEEYNSVINKKERKELQQDQPFVDDYKIWVNPSRFQLMEYNKAIGLDPHAHLLDYAGVGELNEASKTFNFVPGSSIDDYLESDVSLLKGTSHSDEKVRFKSSLVGGEFADMNVLVSAEVFDSYEDYMINQHSNELSERGTNGPLLHLYVADNESERSSNRLIPFDYIGSEQELIGEINESIDNVTMNSKQIAIESFDYNSVKQITKERQEQLDQNYNRER